MPRRRDYAAEYRRRNLKTQQKYGVSYNEYRYWKRQAKDLGVSSRAFDTVISDDNFLTWDEMKELIRTRRKSQAGNQSIQGRDIDRFISDFVRVRRTDEGFQVDSIPDDMIDQWMGWGTP